MTNSNGRGRPEHRALPASPDPRQQDPNQFPPQYDPRQGHPHPAWPEPSHELPQDWTQPGDYPSAADPRYARPEQARYAEPQGQPEPPSQPAGYELPAGWPPQEPAHRPAAAQPETYRYPNEPAAVAEDPYSQPTLGVPGRGQDPRGYHDPRAAGVAAPPSHSPTAYAAQFESYVPPEHAAEPAAVPQPAAVDPYAHERAEASLRGATYDDWPSSAPPQQAEQRPAAPAYQEPAIDPRFAEAEARHQQYYQQQQQDYQAPQEYEQPQDYPDPQAYEPTLDDWTGRPQAAHAPEQAYSQQAYAHPEPAVPDAAGYAQAEAAAWQQPEYADYDTPPTGAPDPYAQAAVGDPGQPVAVGDGYDEYDEEYEDDEPRSGVSRLMMIAAALVGAIVVGAGLAFGYKTFLGPDAKIAAGPPVVRGDSQAGKVRPSDPGGRQFGHSDSKMLGRMSDQGRKTANTNPDGSRRVSTLQIGRDGTVYNQGAAPLPSGAPPKQPVVSVPGLTIVDGFAGQRAAADRARQAAVRQPIVVSPPKAQVNALSPVRPALPKKTSPPPVAKVTPVAPRKPPVARKTTPPARPTAAPVVPRSTGGNGYVAVLASVPVSGTSRLDALKTFADIQQNYGSVLGNRTPDVREANLGEKGRYHRLMVGPPASRESANALCKQLKSAGYASCWITAY